MDDKSEPPLSFWMTNQNFERLQIIQKWENPNIPNIKLGENLCRFCCTTSELAQNEWLRSYSQSKTSTQIKVESIHICRIGSFNQCWYFSAQKMFKNFHHIKCFSRFVTLDSTFQQMHVWKPTLFMTDSCHNKSFWYQNHMLFLQQLLFWYNNLPLFCDIVSTKVWHTTDKNLRFFNQAHHALPRYYKYSQVEKLSTVRRMNQEIILNLSQHIKSDNLWGCYEKQWFHWLSIFTMLKMQILLNSRSIRDTTTIRDVFSMRTSLPKWGRGTILLTIALLSNFM